MTSYLRTPGQASKNFGLGSTMAARPRGLFFVRFRRPSTSSSGSLHGDDFGFVVKSLDQPKISIKTEEVSQYNKKRQVHTGYDLSPITMTLFDTVNGTARGLWQEYLKYHFGDFRQNTDGSAWGSDLQQENMNGADIGFGLTLPPEGPSQSESARYYFHTIEILQVYTGLFTKTVLVNPRIISFDPDDLDYEQMTPSTYRMQITYETVLFEDNKPIEFDPEIKELFGRPELEGNALDLPNEETPVSTFVTTQPPFGTGDGAFAPGNSLFGGFGGNLGSLLGGLGGLVGNGATRSARTGSGGVLGSLGGGFNFGNLAATAVTSLLGGGSRRNLGSELVYAATNNRALAGIVQMVEGGSRSRLLTAGVGLLQRASPTTSPVIFDAARALIASRSGNRQGAAAMAGSLVRGLITSSAATRTTPAQNARRSSSGGLSLSSATIGEVNKRRSPTAPIGNRKAPPPPRKGR